MKRLALLALLFLALLAAWYLQRLRGGEDGAASLAVVLARERAAAHFAGGDLARARGELAPLLASDEVELEDLVRAAAVEFLDRGRGGEPGPLLARIEARAPGHPVLHYARARLALEQGDLAGARAHFEAVLADRPDDAAARVGLGAVLDDLGHPEEARAQLAEVVARGVEQGGGWYVQAVHRLHLLARRRGPEDEAQRLGDLFQQLTDLGYRAASEAELDRGTLVGVAPAPGGSAGAVAGRVPEFEAEELALPELAGAHALLARDLDGDGDTDFLAATSAGLWAAFAGPAGYALEQVLAGRIEHVRAFDLANADELDLLVTRGGELLLLEHRSGAELLLGRADVGRWKPSELVLPSLPAPVADLAAVDFDHDGDLDWLVVGAFGARLLRNDGAAPRGGPDDPRGSFVDASAEASLPRDVALAWCVTEDLDGDQDVDLLLGGPGGLFLMDGLRAGRFEDVAARRFGAAPIGPVAPLCADLDADARPDLLLPGAPARLWRQREVGSFAAEELHTTVGTEPRALDLDLDGTLDLLWRAADGTPAGVLGFGLEVARPFALGAGSGPLAVADLEADLDLDLVRAGPRGLELLRCVGPVGRAVRIELAGFKDNRRGIGAVLEARTRGLYRRLYGRGEPELLGFGAHAALDVLRVTWPNGAVQTRLDLAPSAAALLDAARLAQPESLIGSCPFLYAWNGRTFGFVTDVLGVTPLGLPLAPGVLVPPDHDEYVLVRGEELVPRDGRLVLQLTEELREVTYLDHARLEVLDHPAEIAVHPNERFTFPPFPEPHVHTVRAPLAPRRATGSDGRDWSAALGSVDGVHARPFEPLAPQFLGLATPHWLELEFDPQRTRGAPRLRLVATGWFFWTDASVNVASARTPGVAFVPPTLEVEGPDGTWRAAGPPLGFPAGKSKTMVVDVTELVDRERPRFRIASTLRLYWDALTLAVDADDGERRVTPLEPARAYLWSRGFSEPLPGATPDQPERFEWERLTRERRWDPHPGDYTRLGEVLPLVTTVDDCFVILASGDALTLEFDARGLPPLPPGWRRDYLLYLDGWAKDRDPNTLSAQAVEPLPFHGMSAYPYGPDERFPDGQRHRAWRAEWNVRRIRPWIAPLAPRREAEWAADLARRP
ncbi:MAG TPA: FG-GAP-like repeat-containing protein [Planctomycetota bacterium]